MWVNWNDINAQPIQDLFLVKPFIHHAQVYIEGTMSHEFTERGNYCISVNGLPMQHKNLTSYRFVVISSQMT